MRLSIVWTIFRKEITEALRDRLTLLVVIGIPVLAYPLMMMGVGKLAESRAAAEEERVSNVAVWGSGTERLLAALQHTNTLSVHPWKGIPAGVRQALEQGNLLAPPDFDGDADGASAKQRVRSGRTALEGELPQAAHSLVTSRELDAVLVLWPGFNEAVAAGGSGKVSIYYDSVRPASAKARDRINRVLVDFRQALVRERERTHGLEEGFSIGVEVRAHNLAPPKRQLGERLGMLLPLALILLSAAGAVYAAIDLTAGEKDRATMQTLLCAPVSSLEIVSGKFLAVWCVSLIAAVANTASLGATMARITAPAGLPGIPLLTCLQAFALLLPVTCTLTASFLAIAVLARDAKDAGNFLSAGFTIFTLPLIAAAMPGVELNARTAFLPLVNASLLIKALFVGEASLEAAFLTLLSSAAYAVLALLFAARAFGREQVLLGGQGSIRTLFRSERRPGEPPSPGLALTTFAFCLVLAFYGSLLLQASGVILSTLAVEYAFFLTPVLVLWLVFKFPATQTFSLRLPGWRALVGAVAIGLTGWIVVGGIVIRLFPPPDSVVKALERIVLLEDEQVSLEVAWLVLAITPAIGEELLFRGVILSGLRRLGNWPALLISSFLFAAVHASIYRLLPTFCLGLLIGYAVLRTGSIVSGMVIHALNNGIAITLARSPDFTRNLGLSETAFIPMDLTLASMAVVVLALLLFRRMPTPPNAWQSSPPLHRD